MDKKSYAQRAMDKMDSFGKNSDGKYPDMDPKAIYKALGNDFLIEELEKAKQKAEEDLLAKQKVPVFKVEPAEKK